MFNTADTKGKALLALGCSLGWEISAVLELERTFMQNLIAKAKSEKAEYYYFKTIRQKTGAPRLGVLNPLAILWVGRYLEETKDKAPRKRRSAGFNPVGSLFDIHPVTVNNYLRAVAGEARIVVTGRVHWHKIRGWVMSTLSRSGLNEFQIKYIVGKSIPLSDSTYLQSLRLEIEERYPQAYELYLNIGSSVSEVLLRWMGCCMLWAAVMRCIVFLFICGRLSVFLFGVVLCILRLVMVGLRRWFVFCLWRMGVCMILVM